MCNCATLCVSVKATKSAEIQFSDFKKRESERKAGEICIVSWPLAHVSAGTWQELRPAESRGIPAAALPFWVCVRMQTDTHTQVASHTSSSS